MARLLGIDIGTSGCKAIVIDETGRVVAQASESYPVSMPYPTWSEQDPEDWWNGVQACLHSLARGSGLEALGIAAIGLTGQMHGAVFLDGNGDVTRPAILWNDQRTTEECADIERIVGAQRVREITCNPPLTGFQLPKILWLRKHEPENFVRVRKVLLPKDYIRFRLTGEFFTEVSDASGTGIFDVRKREWSRDMMDALDLDPSIFPSVVESIEQTREAFSVERKALSKNLFEPRATSLEPRAIPVFGGGGDQAAGAVGVGAVREGVINVSLGTSGVVFSAVDAMKAIDAMGANTASDQFRTPSGGVIAQRAMLRESLHTFCHANGKWHVMGVMLACGGALSWYAQNVRHESIDDVMAEAAGAESGCGGLTFLPHLNGERSPHNDPHARAAFAGLNLSHSSKEMSRAVIEGITFGLRDCYEGLGARGSRLEAETSAAHENANHEPQAPSLKPRVRVTGGGAKSRFWVQMIADVFGCPVGTLEADEGPAFGAALIAGVGANVWPDLQAACDATIRIRERLEPSGVEYEEPYQRYRALYPHLREWFRT